MEFIAGIVTIESFGDYMLARFATGVGGLAALVIGYAAYGVLLWLFIRAIRTKGLAWSNSAWDGWSNLATGLVAILMLGERPTIKEFAGMLLITAGLFLLGTNGTAKKQHGKTGGSD